MTFSFFKLFIIFLWETLDRCRGHTLLGAHNHDLGYVLEDSQLLCWVHSCCFVFAMFFVYGPDALVRAVAVVCKVRTELRLFSVSLVMALRHFVSWWREWALGHALVSWAVLLDGLVLLQSDLWELGVGSVRQVKVGHIDDVAVYFSSLAVVVKNVPVDVLVKEVFVLRHGTLRRDDWLLRHVGVDLCLGPLALTVKDWYAAFVLGTWSGGHGVVTHSFLFRIVG